MANKVIFLESFQENFGDIISEDEVVDIVDLFFDGDDAEFVITGEINKKGIRGLFRKLGHINEISIDRSEIESSFKRNLRMGGNKSHSSLKKAICSVLAHEIQHANQSLTRSNQKWFWEGRYFSRPCEKDARRAADANSSVIDAMIDDIITAKQPNDSKREDDLNDLIELLSFSENITIDEVKEVLREEKLFNSVNLKKVIQKLGISVEREKQEAK